MHSDHLGSPELITNAAGAQVVKLSFGAYGERRDSDWDGAVSSGDMTTIGNTIRHGFTGHEHLDSVGLVHMNGRVYDPVVGRFLSADPFIDWGLGTQGANRYGYVGNNPLSFTDPSGYRTFGDPEYIKTLCTTGDCPTPLPEIVLTGRRIDPADPRETVPPPSIPLNLLPGVGYEGYGNPGDGAPVTSGSAGGAGSTVPSSSQSVGPSNPPVPAPVSASELARGGLGASGLMTWTAEVAATIERSESLVRFFGRFGAAVSYAEVGLALHRRDYGDAAVTFALTTGAVAALAYGYPLVAAGLGTISVGYAIVQAASGGS